MPIDPKTSEGLNKFQSFTLFYIRLISIANSIGSIWIFGLMFLICADVIFRGAFNMPLRGVPEIAGYSLVGAVFLQLAHSLHVGKFARAEMFIEPLTLNRPIGANCFHLIFNLIGVLVFALIVYGTWFKFQEAWPDLKFGVENEFTILVWPLRLIILCGSLLVSLKYFIQLIENISQFKNLVEQRRTSENKIPTG